MANLERMKKHSFELKKDQNRVNTLEGDLKKANEGLVAEVKAREASDDLVAKSLIEVDAARENMDKALHDLVELQKVATGLMYERVFSRDYNRDGDSYMR